MLSLDYGMITLEQCRAARGWLGWTQQDLAAKARVGLSTVRDFEAGRRTPIANNLEAIRRALEGDGIQFVFDADGVACGIAGAPKERAEVSRLPPG